VALLEVRELRKAFEGNKRATGALAVDSLSFDVDEGQLFTMLGPSGCGKTTTLRCIAGLEYPDAGEIIVSGRTFFSGAKGTRVPANRRNLGMVFQSYAIWPHMTVFQNAAFPLAVKSGSRRVAKAEIVRRVERVLAVVQLSDLAGRRATDLSGGQQQRLALARAIVMEPPMLLLDEPLSNLDAKLRQEMRFELKRLQRDLGITTVYVTHDQAEALAISDRIGVMNAGRFEQVGGPVEIYRSPTSHFVADFIGASNLLDGRVRNRTDDGFVVDTPLGLLEVPSPLHLEPKAAVLVSVRPEHVMLLPVDLAPPEAARGQVIGRAFLGNSIDYMVAVGDIELGAQLDGAARFGEGDRVVVVADSAQCSLVLP